MEKGVKNLQQVHRAMQKKQGTEHHDDSGISCSDPKDELDDHHVDRYSSYSNVPSASNPQQTPTIQSLLNSNQQYPSSFSHSWVLNVSPSSCSVGILDHSSRLPFLRLFLHFFWYDLYYLTTSMTIIISSYLLTIIWLSFYILLAHVAQQRQHTFPSCTIYFSFFSLWYGKVELGHFTFINVIHDILRALGWARIQCLWAFPVFISFHFFSLFSFSAGSKPM